MKSLALLLFAAATVGCTRPSCLGGGGDCHVAEPCQQLTFTCAEPLLEVRILDGTDSPGGINALGRKGDYLLGNSRAVAVLAGLGNQNYVDPNGGSLLDLVNRGANNDGINQLLQVVGILPRDAAHYLSAQMIDERPRRVAVEFRGTLDGQPDIPIYTVYEMRACEPGVRVRTEVVNRSPNSQLWALSDGFYFSKRELLPFTPGTGFDHPSFNLLTINGAFQTAPFLAASTHHSATPASYAIVGCDQPRLAGFQSETVSSFGLPQTVVPPRDYLAFERFVAVAPVSDIAGAADLALELRRQLFQERAATVRGRVDFGMPIHGVDAVTVQIAEGTPSMKSSERVRWTEVVPDAQGAFSARLPAERAYVIEYYAFGRKVAERAVPWLASDVEVAPVEMSLTTRLSVAVLDPQGKPVDAELFLRPVDEITRSATEGSYHGQFGPTAPWLGSPHGGSPAGNRLLAPAGAKRTALELPPGRYWLYAYHGPFWTIARKQLEASTAGELVFDMMLSPLALKPSGSVSADMHVHGGASFDSGMPDSERVLSFVAADVDVIIATDHDVVYDYAPVVEALGLSNRLTTVAGVETTGHIPFLYTPGGSFPLVIGHYNFWPLKYQPTLPRNGGPFDELVEPGALFDRVEPLYSSTVPIIQLNHPWAEAEFGRDLGYPRALGLNLITDLPAKDDGTVGGMYVRAPNPGGHHSNDHHAQEVMNGTRNDTLLAYRALWFYGLNQGELKTGTANSDSHTLGENTVGSPRNLVFAATQAGPSFKIDLFNQAVRDGALIGTNGPVILASVRGADGFDHSFGMKPFRPADQAVLKIEVDAAPWVPVDEIRIVVNGQVKKTITGLVKPDSPFGTVGLVRYLGEVALLDLLPPSGDAWLVIEAGFPLLPAADLGGGPKRSELPHGALDGMPDTTDNNGDGKIDFADIAADEKVGPLSNPPPPRDEGDPRFHFAQVVPDAFPMAFTNPFLFDRDGNGRFDAPGRVK